MSCKPSDENASIVRSARMSPNIGQLALAAMFKACATLYETVSETGDAGARSAARGDHPDLLRVLEDVAASLLLHGAHRELLGRFDEQTQRRRPPCDAREVEEESGNRGRVTLKDHHQPPGAQLLDHHRL